MPSEMALIRSIRTGREHAVALWASLTGAASFGR